ncbi:MAG: FHA domain-containing protein [Microthrixaceae bacterium]
MKDLIVRVGSEEYTFGPGATVRLGRNPGSDVVITNSNVSREHALLSNESGIWHLSDAGSSQGTWRDGQRVEQLELRGTVHVTLGREDRGTPIVIEAPTVANEELLRPGGPMADSELGESTEVVGAERGPRGRMDQTVIVNDSAPADMQHRSRFRGHHLGPRLSSGLLNRQHDRSGHWWSRFWLLPQWP